MKEKIIDSLLSNLGDFVSGEELSRDLNITRSAVWKYICELRYEGYMIEAVPRRGYRLNYWPDLLHPREIKRYLKTVRMGKTIEYFRVIDSTNRLAKELALEGSPEGTMVVAEEQTKGRGRLDHKWISPRGGIWLSLILRPALLPYQASLLTILAALAVVQAVKEVTGLTAKIKWPNDLLVNEKKLAGILTEMNAEIDLINFVVIGIGINVNVRTDNFSEELAGITVSLMEKMGKEVLRPLLLGVILNRIEILYNRAQSEGFGEIIREWKEHGLTLGRRVKVNTPNGVVVGECVGINENGALMIETDQKKVISIMSGDVSLLNNGVI